MDWSKMINRLVRAALLDTATYEEVEADTSLNQEALVAVILVSVIGAIGSFLGALFLGDIVNAVVGLVVVIVMGVVGYYLWAYITWWVGTKLLGGTADVGELLRTLGYASGPRALQVLGFIPILNCILGLLIFVWTLATGVVAVRSALDFDTGKALITVAIGAVIVFLVTALITTLLGLGGVGLGAILS